MKKIRHRSEMSVDNLYIASTGDAADFANFVSRDLNIRLGLELVATMTSSPTARVMFPLRKTSSENIRYCQTVVGHQVDSMSVAEFLAMLQNKGVIKILRPDIVEQEETVVTILDDKKLLGEGRGMSDYQSKFKTNLERWRYYLSDYEAPDIFIDWTYYAMIGAALQRRVSIGTYPQSHISAPNNVYPNLYVVFIAEPGIGKSQTANQAKYVFSSFDTPDKDGKIKQIIKRAPDSVTLEAFTRFLHNHYTVTPVPEELAGSKGKVYSHSSVAFFCGDELGTLLRENSNDLVIFLNQGWDCGDFHRETKTQGVDVVKNMCISLLGAATPSWVKENVSTRVLGEGFSARCIFVYAGAKRFSRFRYNITPEQKQEMEIVRRHVESLSKLFGEVKIPKDVDDWCRDWYEKRFIIINKSRLLKDYYARKKVHLMKVAMCMHFADSTTLELTIKDFERALMFLEKTELEMDKALNAAGTNPIYAIATGILTYLEKKPDKKEMRKQILVDFYNEGDMTQIEEAFQFLAQTGKIEMVEKYVILREGEPSE